MARSRLLLGFVAAGLLAAVVIYNGLSNGTVTRDQTVLPRLSNGGVTRDQIVLPPTRIGEHVLNGREQQHQQQKQQQQQQLQQHQQQEGEQGERGPGLVELSFMGRLGNNLFEYATARVVADKLGWALSLKALLNKDRFKTLLKPHGKACFPGVRPLGPPPSRPEMAKLEEVRFRGLEREMADPTPRKIHMQDWFQEYRVFASEKDRIRQILALDPSCCGPTAPGPNDMVIHYRNYKAELGKEQYEKLHFQDLDFEYYDTVLRSTQDRPETVWVVGEFHEYNPLVKRLQEEHDNVKIAEMVTDQFRAFCFLSRAPRLIMAQSTFSWWAAFLGNATEVHFPFQPTRKAVTGRQIVVDDDTRYIYRDRNGLVVRPQL